MDSPIPPKTLALLLLAAVLWPAAGCGRDTKGAGPAAAGQPETVDVESVISVPTNGDVQAAPPRRGLVGVLPGDFPSDLPIYLPASIIDFGRGDGRRFVLLQSPDARQGVEAWLRRAAVKAGFKVQGQGGRLLLQKGERQFHLSFAGQGTTEFRYEY